MNEFDQKAFEEWIVKTIEFLKLLPAEKAREAVVFLAKETAEYLSFQSDYRRENADLIRTMFK